MRNPNTQQCDCGRFTVERLTLHHGRAYCAWDQHPSIDWAPVLIKVENQAVKAWGAVERYLYPQLFEK
jgi:hypothetical protein